MNPKSKSLVFILLFVLSTILVGCGGAAQNNGREAERNQEESSNQVIESGEKLVIYTSMYPLYDFTKKIAGEKAEVVNLIPAGAEPHDYELTAQDIMSLSGADLFIYNGGGFETWLERMAEAVNNPNLALVDSTQYITLLTNEETGHVHDEDDEHEHSHDHDKEEHDDDNHIDDHNHHDHDGLDHHVWVDPNLAKQQAAAIKDALVAVDEANKEYYEGNFTELAAQFDALDVKFKDLAEHIERRDFVVSHAAFGYLALRYDLNQVPISGLTLDEPSTKQLQDIISFIQENQIKYILFESLVTTKVAEVVQEEVGAEALILHNLEGLSEEELSQGKDYFSVMEENVEVLKKALGYKNK